MWTNPIRSNLRDAVRALKRYPALWLILGLCGFSYAFFHLAAQVYLAMRVPAEEAVGFVLFREPFRWEPSWWYGTEHSLWYLREGTLGAALHEAVAPAVENTAGI